MKKHLTVDQSLTNATQTLHREAIGLVSKMGASFKGGGVLSGHLVERKPIGSVWKRSHLQMSSLGSDWSVY